MKVLVTGGAGFIGSAFCRASVARGWTVLNLDKLSYAADLRSLDIVADAPNYAFERGDIADPDLLAKLFQEFQPDSVAHFAAETHVDRSITGPAAFIETNVVGVRVLLDAALIYWRKIMGHKRERFRFLHVSTDEVFGSLGEEGIFHEETRYDPRSPYAASKAASDHLVRAWRHTFGLPTLISNCSNNYGPFQFPEKLIPLVTINALEGLNLPVYGDGKNVRDWLFVDDHVSALQLMLQRGAAGETYCIGGRAERGNLDVVRAVCSTLDEIAPSSTIGARERLIEFVPDRPGHDHRYAIDPSKAERELGWTCAVDFETGLHRTVDWYVRNREWWAPIRDRKYAGQRLGLTTEINS